MDWYFSKGGVQLGPVTEPELRAKIASGEVALTDLVWTEGMKDWQPVLHVEGLGSLAQAPPAAPVPRVVPDVDASPYTPPTAELLPPVAGPYIPNYLWQSIVVTIFCCWPFGIPAIVYSAKVDGLRAAGDIAGAMDASSKAKTWCWVAVASWGVLVIGWLLFMGVASQPPTF